MKRFLVVAASFALLVGAAASGASAGEVKGPPGTPGVAGSNAGEPTGAVANSNSICSHSGLNDMQPGQGPIDQITQTPGNQGPPGAPGHGTCAGGSNPTRDK
jgi:hypothetical protein